MLFKIHKIQKKNPGEKIIVNDYFIPRGIFYKKIFFKKNIISFVSFYFPSTLYFKKKGWKFLYSKISYTDSLYNFILFFLRSWVEKISCSFSDFIICNSNEQKNSLTKYYDFPNKKIFTYVTEFNDIPSVFKIKRNKKQILYVGSLQPRKEIDLILDTIDHLPLVYKLYLVGGTKKMISKYKSKKEFKNVFFIEKKDKSALKKIYLESEIFLFPSKWEGSARVIKEAMSYNLKIICANNSGNKMIDKKGNIFSYVKKNDPKYYAKAILNLQNKRIYKSKLVFDSQTVAENIFKIYDQTN